MTKLADRKAAIEALRNIGVTIGSERWPTPEDVIRGSREAHANILHKARCDLVKKYRSDSPTTWPDGITHRNSSDQWYRAEEWNDKGEWIAKHKPPWLISAEAPTKPDNVSLAPPTEKPSPQQVAAAIRTVLPRTDSPRPIQQPIQSA